MNEEEIIRRLDRIERMLFDSLKEDLKEKYKEEKIKEYEIKLKIAQRELEEGVK